MDLPHLAPAHPQWNRRHAIETDGQRANGRGWANPALDQFEEAARERLRRTLEGHDLPLDGLCQAAVDRLALVRPLDDVVLLLAKTRTLAADRVASWDLPAEPAVVAQARESAMRQLASWGLDELTSDPGPGAGARSGTA